MIHNRYKDLALVEWVFRISKAAQLEINPVNVRLESRARGHAFVVMIAYQIVKELTVLWRLLDLTVQAALSELDALCSTQVSIAEGGCFYRISEPALHCIHRAAVCLTVTSFCQCGRTGCCNYRCYADQERYYPDKARLVHHEKVSEWNPVRCSLIKSFAFVRCHPDQD